MLLKNGLFQDARAELPPTHQADDGNAPDIDSATSSVSSKSSATIGADSANAMFISSELKDIKFFLKQQNDEKTRKDEKRYYRQVLSEQLQRKQVQLQYLERKLENKEEKKEAKEEKKMDYELKAVESMHNEKVHDIYQNHVEHVSKEIDKLQEEIDQIKLRINEISNCVMILEQKLNLIDMQQSQVQEFDETPKRRGSIGQNSTKSVPVSAVVIQNSQEKHDFDTPAANKSNSESDNESPSPKVRTPNLPSKLPDWYDDGSSTLDPSIYFKKK